MFYFTFWPKILKGASYNDEVVFIIKLYCYWALFKADV